MGTLLVIGHRGASGSAPENTMAAFRLAALQGADGIELDVRLTKDNRLAVHHDSRLGRTSTGRGAIRRLDVSEILAADAGSWFAKKYAGEKIPLLEDALDGLPETLMINIEVKTDGDTGRRNGVARVLAATLDRHAGTRAVIVTSFDHLFLRRFHAETPAVATGALTMPVRDAAKSPARLKRTLGVSAYVCSRSQLRRRMVENARAHHMHVAVYGITAPAHLERAKRFGVDAVITDFPLRTIRALRRC